MVDGAGGNCSLSVNQEIGNNELEERLVADYPRSDDSNGGGEDGRGQPEGIGLLLALCGRDEDARGLLDSCRSLPWAATATAEEKGGRRVSSSAIKSTMDSPVKSSKNSCSSEGGDRSEDVGAAGKRGKCGMEESLETGKNSAQDDLSRVERRQEDRTVVSKDKPMVATQIASSATAVSSSIAAAMMTPNPDDIWAEIPASELAASSSAAPPLSSSLLDFKVEKETHARIPSPPPLSSEMMPMAGTAPPPQTKQAPPETPTATAKKKKQHSAEDPWSSPSHTAAAVATTTTTPATASLSPRPITYFDDEADFLEKAATELAEAMAAEGESDYSEGDNSFFSGSCFWESFPLEVASGPGSASGLGSKRSQQSEKDRQQESPYRNAEGFQVEGGGSGGGNFISGGQENRSAGVVERTSGATMREEKGGFLGEIEGGREAGGGGRGDDKRETGMVDIIPRASLLEGGHTVVLFDLETTGLSAKSDRVIQLAAKVRLCVFMCVDMCVCALSRAG